MNYYNKNNDYYNYVNNTYNQPLYNQSSNNKKILDPYNGFVRGNMFSDLYNGYKLNKPLDITPLNEQADMLTYIDSLCFALIDLNLYLDLYPNDSKIIELFNSYRMEKDEITKEYESKYGPLTLNSDSLNKAPWAWDNMPWPWEGV
ncbi:MAG: spore coat protein CotJB [Firmicutes bacterium]|nr:spore coat protein CotJB [Bacillota bacterium]